MEVISALEIEYFNDTVNFYEQRKSEQMKEI